MDSVKSMTKHFADVFNPLTKSSEQLIAEYRSKIGSAYFENQISEPRKFLNIINKTGETCNSCFKSIEKMIIHYIFPNLSESEEFQEMLYENARNDTLEFPITSTHLQIVSFVLSLLLLYKVIVVLSKEYKLKCKSTGKNNVTNLPNEKSPFSSFSSFLENLFLPLTLAKYFVILFLTLSNLHRLFLQFSKYLPYNLYFWVLLDTFLIIFSIFYIAFLYIPEHKRKASFCVYFIATLIVSIGIPGLLVYSMNSCVFGRVLVFSNVVLMLFTYLISKIFAQFQSQ